MAIFELDGGRGSVVQPMRPRSDSFEVDSATLVGDHAAALLGEPVLTVRRGGPGGPHLLALDPASRPVVVEVAQLLDEAALVRALRHAGSATRLSRADLARLYQGGADAFEADLAVFRDRAPILASQREGGVRLVVLCAEVADGVLDAVEFLTAGGRLEVQRLGVTQGPGGRRYVEVAPVRPGTPGAARRAVEPGPRTGAIQVAPRASGAAVTDPTPVVRQPADVPTPHGDVAAPAPAPAPASVPVPDPASNGTSSTATPPLPERHGRRADETTLLAPVDPAGPVPGADGVHDPLPELAALAAAERQALELVWHRVRRGQRHVATLRADGLIELEDGSVHADPGAAATVAADLESPTDGWRVWRFGDDGPTLGEAVGLRG